MADLGERPGGPDPALFWAKNEKITEGRKAGRTSKTKPGPSPTPSLPASYEKMVTIHLHSLLSDIKFSCLVLQH